MKHVITLLFLAITMSVVKAQLKPSIGLTQKPASSDAICNITTYSGGFASTGYQKGDTVADFTLYDLEGKAFNLSDELSKGQPVLLIAGSYTCPVFRNKMATINEVLTDYEDKVSIIIVYVVEAHPIDDPSPYSGKEWITGQNQDDKVLFKQPTNYGERTAMLVEMQKKMSFLPRILLDGPCNSWWKKFGPAPNNAYLLQTNGVVFAKHGWFDKSPDNIVCDLDKILGKTCVTQNTGGSFTWQMSENNTKFGAAGTTISIHGKLINNSSSNAVIEIMRLQNDVSNGWASAMCTDICLQDWVDTTELILAAGDTQSYTMYFYTGENGNEEGHTRIGFRNKEKTNNKFSQDFYGKTWTSSIAEMPCILNGFPNPTSHTFQFNTIQDGEVFIYDNFGRLLLEYKTVQGLNTLHLEHLLSGTYFLLWRSNALSMHTRISKI